MKLLATSLGILCILSYAPYIHAEVDGGRVNFSDHAFEKMIPLEICNCVAFRMDDIQNYWLLEPQLEVLETFREYNVPITIGVIGNDFEEDIVKYIRNVTNSENSNIEIANHSWAHEDFSLLDKDHQNQSIKNTNDRIFNMTGLLPKIFYPPFGVSNNSTLEVLRDHNFTIMSSTFASSPPPYPLVISGIHHFPATALTADYVAESKMFEGLPFNETLKDIQNSQEKFGFSVVALHPQEFAMIENGEYVDKVNQEQIQELALLIEEIQKSDLKTVFVSQINDNLIKNPEYLQTGSSNSVSSGVWMIWVVPAVAGIVGAGVYLVKFRARK
ncbi:MAG: polysaccharide deacetylase family protein [Nitrosopumilus sp.]|nr:polysaccharide deacetylase family protein [Nitrosopumilus sp.]MDH3384635.1 polysaccharide deacetylase family protein [Nitrosopumilus sp.]